MSDPEANTVITVNFDGNVLHGVIMGNTIKLPKFEVDMLSSAMFIVFIDELQLFING